MIKAIFTLEIDASKVQRPEYSTCDHNDEQGMDGLCSPCNKMYNSKKFIREYQKAVIEGAATGFELIIGDLNDGNEPDVVEVLEDTIAEKISRFYDSGISDGDCPQWDLKFRVKRRGQPYDLI